MADGFVWMHLRDTVMIAANVEVRILTAQNKLLSISLFQRLHWGPQSEAELCWSKLIGVALKLILPFYPDALK